MYYVYVTSGPSLLIESTDSMIKLLSNLSIMQNIYKLDKFDIHESRITANVLQCHDCT